MDAHSHLEAASISREMEDHEEMGRQAKLHYERVVKHQVNSVRTDGADWVDRPTKRDLRDYTLVVTKDMTRLARMIKYVDTELADELYITAESFLRDEKCYGKAAQVALERRDYKTAYDLFVKDGHFLRAVNLANKVKVSPRKRDRLERLALEQKTMRDLMTFDYIGDHFGHRDMRAARRVKPQQLARRFGKERLYLDLLVRDFRIVEAFRYAEENGFDDDAKYLRQVWEAKERMRKLGAKVRPVFYFPSEADPPTSGYCSLDLLTQLVSLKQEGLDQVVFRAEMQAERLRETVHAYLNNTPVEALGPEHRQEAALRREDLYYLLLEEYYGTFSTSDDEEGFEREKQDLTVMINCLSEQSPFYAYSMAERRGLLEDRELGRMLRTKVSRAARELKLITPIRVCLGGETDIYRDAQSLQEAFWKKITTSS